MSTMKVDEALKVLQEDWVDESTIIKQVRQFSFEDFIENEQRLDILVRICLKFSNNHSKIQQTSTLGEVLVQATTILLCSGCHDQYPSIFDSFVRLLWKLISGENANVFKTRQLRSICCECLREIELCLPGALEALVRPRNGHQDERSLLETLVAEERSNSFQSYLILLMTILSSPPPAVNGAVNGLPPSSAMHTVALALDSCGLLSLYARADLILVICSYAKTHENEIVCRVVGEKCVEALANQSSCIATETMVKSLMALHSSSSVSSSIDFDASQESSSHLSNVENIHGVDRILQSIVHDQGAFISLRYLALSILDVVNDGSSNNQMGWPSPFDSLELATNISISSLRKTRNVSIPNDLLSSIMWFAEDYWREDPPNRLTDAAFQIFDVFVELFPQHCSQVADAIIHGALLRGNSRFFAPINRIIDLGKGRYRTTTKNSDVPPQSSTMPKVEDEDENHKCARRMILERIADSILDVSNERELGGYLELLLFALVPARNKVSKRILKTLERFVSTFDFNKNGFATIMAFLDCIRISLWLCARYDLKAFRFCNRLLDDFETKCEKDFIVSDEIRVIRNSAHRFRNGIHEAEDVLLSLDNIQAFNFGSLVDIIVRPSEKETTAANMQIKKMLGPLKRRTVAMDRLVTLRRASSIDESSLIPEMELNDIERTTTFVQEAEYLLIPLRVEWEGDESNDVELFAIAIHLLPNANLGLVGLHPSPILIPHLSSSRPSHSVMLQIKPSFPMPMRLSFRALATDSNGWMVEGALQDIHLDFKDFFSSIPRLVHSENSIKSVVVRNRVSIEQFAAFKQRVFGLYLEPCDNNFKVNQNEWKAKVNLLASYSLHVYGRYLEPNQQAVFECSVNHWVLLSYLDDLFRL